MKGKRKDSSRKEDLATTAGRLTPEEQAALSSAPPKVEGYHVTTMLGEGGMGVVYLAEQQKPIKRRVALKVIKPGMDSKRVLARFEAEEQALALLDHPNIAQVYEAGMTRAGRPYFAMEYVKGVPITEYCDRERLSIEDRLNLFLQVCDAIGHAHQKGIIHRDVKPSNILVFIEGKHVTPKVIDFGVSKAISQPLTERTLFTEQGHVIGTPEYMSPEQAEMAGQDIDTRTDIYSLGVLLYQLLTGVLPFDPKTLRQAAFDEIRRMIREQEPPRPSTRLSSLGEQAKKVARSRRTRVAALAKRLNKELEWIPLKAMRKERTRRYRSASELADDIQNYLSGAPLIAGPESAVYRVKKFVRKYRLPVTAVAAVAASVVIGLVVSTMMYLRAESLRVEADRARQQEAAARARAEEAEQSAQEQRKLAQERADAYRRESYFTRIASAQALYRQGDVTRVRELLKECPLDLRGWEWHRLWHLSDEAFMTLSGHKDRLTSVAVSPDGKRIVSGNSDRTMKVWDVSTGAEVMMLRGHTDEVVHVVFSPDGRRIASSSYDRTIKLWDAATGAEVVTLRGHTGKVFSVAFGPDGKRIVSGDTDGMIKVWDAETYGELRTLRAHKDGSVYAVFSPDGKGIVSGGTDKTIKLWDATSGSELMTLQGHKDQIICVAFSPDGARIASGSWDKTIKLWDAATGEELMTMRGHRYEVFELAFSPDGKRIVSGSADHTVKLWDAITGAELMTLHGHEAPVSAIAFSPDGNWIVSGARDNTVKVWDPAIERGALTLRGHVSYVHCVSFSPNHDRIASGTGDGKIKLWNTVSGAEVLTLRGHRDGVRCLSFSPDGERIASGSWDNAIKVWDVANGNELIALRGHEKLVWCVAFSLDGKLIVSGSGDCSIRVWDAGTGAGLLTLLGHTGPVRCVGFSPDGTRIFSGSEDGSVRIWSGASSKELKKLHWRGQKSVSSLWVSPDGERIVSCGNNDTITIWDVSSGTKLKTLAATTTTVLACMAVSPDWTRLLSGGAVDPIKLRDIATGTEVMTLQGHSRWVDAVAFSPDGKTVAIGSRDGVVTLLESAEPPRGYGARRTAEAARKAVEQLYQKQRFYYEVIDKLQEHNMLAEATRQIALQIANSRLWEDAEKLNEESWGVVCKPRGDSAAYHEALDKARKANELEPGNWRNLRTLGVAQYRLGAHQDALNSITGADRMRADAGDDPDAANLAFTGMVLYQRQRQDEAQDALERLRGLFEDNKLADDKKAQDSLIEAEKLFAGENNKLLSAWDSIEEGKLEVAMQLIVELRSSGCGASEIAGAVKWLARSYYNRVKNARYGAGASAEAIAGYEEVLSIEPDHAPALNDLAWLRATCSVAEFRDGAKAVEEATKACELTNWRNFEYLSTLAAACSEVGDFTSAVRRQEEAIDSLSNDRRAEWGANYKVRLKLYQSGTSYHEGPWTENPIAWWKFDETSGSVAADSSGKGYDGVAVYGQPIWHANGKFGGCLDFDESYGFAIPKDVFTYVNKAITISVWVNGDPNQVDHANVILQAGPEAYEYGWGPYIVTVGTRWQDDGEVVFRTGYNKSGAEEVDRVTFDAAPRQWADNWNHYTFVKDADKGFQRIYLNGEMVAGKTGTTESMGGIDAARIGIAPDRYGDQYIGKLDDLRIYNYALSEAEIKAVYASKDPADEETGRD